MKKFKLGLFPRVVIAIVVGALLGLILPEVVIRIFKTFNVLFAQLLKFIVPLLVLGLVTPSIANLGRGAGKMLLTVMAIAYCSTVCAGIFSYGVSSNLLPMYLSPGELSSEFVSEKEYLPYIDLKIPPICDIMTALVLSFVLGVGIIFTNSSALKKGFDEFGEIVKLTIEKVIIPFLPVYIFTMICEMSAKGVITVVLGTGFKVILTGVILSIIYLIIQYCVTGLIARKNPIKMLWNIVPAYLTGFSICSSSACIPVTYECALKNGVRKDIADFVIPLCSTVHMCGSTIKLTVTSVAVAYMFGMPLTFGLFLQFALMQAIAAVAAPGVMGGVLMASIGLLCNILGFTDTMTTLIMTLYLALDGYGPAVNVSGDAAIAVITDKIFAKDSSAK
jgi:Na+/H+-dicarboxylate symporter